MKRKDADIKYDLLLKTTSQEFEMLQTEEEKIIKRAISTFNDYWQPKIKKAGIEAQIKYNNERGVVGIFIKSKDTPDYKLILQRDGSIESSVAVNILREASNILDRYDIENREKWIR
ncbi:MAG: hypothetical protein PHU12_01410 [Candidatus Aenigmarchaeota archaeon]|nr:hypothetical protein [Candidatus Aenigmarchaeota archaeon]